MYFWIQVALIAIFAMDSLAFLGGKFIVRLPENECACTYVIPVCGEDGRVYPSDCDAKCVGVKVKNTCPGTDPVCGSNGEKYNNKCLAECEGATVVKRKPPCS